MPPVKVGDTVYEIFRGEKIKPITIDRIQYSSIGMDIFGRDERYYRAIQLDPDNKIGVEWYTSKEEAEKALKGGTINE